MFDKPTRNHITIILERVGFLFVFIFIIAGEFMLESVYYLFDPAFWEGLLHSIGSGPDWLYLLGGAAMFFVMVLVLAISFIFWRKTFFYIEGENLIYERKTLFKKYSKLPLNKIATVNIDRNLFERIVGTSKVKIDLNSSHTANSTDFSFVLSEAVAIQLRDRIVELKRGEISPEEAFRESVSGAPRAQRKEIISFSVFQAIRHAVLSFPLIQILFFIFTFIVLPLSSGGLRGVLLEALAGMWIFVFFAAVSLVYGTLNKLNYKVEKDNENIYIHCGALKKTDYSFNINRVNAVFLKQPLLARIFRLYSVEVAVVGFGNEKKESPQLCLLVNKAQAQAIMRECVPSFSEIQGKKTPSHKAAVIPLFIGFFFLSLVLIPSFIFFSGFLKLAPLLLLLFFLLFGFLSYKTKSLEFDENVFYYSSGIFSKITRMFKFSNIQDVTISSNVLMSRRGAGKMRLSILSSNLHKNHVTGWFDIAELETVSGKMVEHEDASTELYISN